MRYAGKVFDNNLAHVLTFYRNELDSQHVIHVFFESFVKKKNLTSPNYCCLIFKKLVFHKSCERLIRMKN